MGPVTRGDHARLTIQQLPALTSPDGVVREQVDSLLAFLTGHKDEGMFLLTGRDDRDRFLKRYGLASKATEPRE